MPHFNTLEYVEILTTAGVPSIQAKAFARAQEKVITESLETTLPRALATKADLIGVKTDVAVLKTDVAILKTDVAILKSDVTALKSDVNGLKSDVNGLKTDFTELKVDVISLKADNKLFKWLFGFLISGLMAVFSGVAALVLKTFL